MKKSIFIAFVLAICFILPIQSQSDDITNLKKQITALKIQNLKLEKTINALKSNANTQSTNTNTRIEELETKLKANSDSLAYINKTLNNNRNATWVIFKSLKHRKHLFITGSLIGIVLLAGIIYYICKKYKADRKKQEASATKIKEAIEEELMKAKTDLLAQISSAKDTLDRKINEQDKMIHDLKNK
jgi:septal ring factor EnvC (AmiA/AmiB activator)